MGFYPLPKHQSLRAAGLVLAILLGACAQATPGTIAGADARVVPAADARVARTDGAAGGTPTGHALGPGGGPSASPSYHLDHTLGQPSAGTSTASSPSYKITRGILPSVSP